MVILVTEPLPAQPKRNTYVSMPLAGHSSSGFASMNPDRDSIYQSIEYETPAPRHQYASIDEPDRDTSGQINRGKLWAYLSSPNSFLLSSLSFTAFENQLYNQSHGFAPPSYNAVITETLATTHPTTK